MRLAAFLIAAALAAGCASDDDDDPAPKQERRPPAITSAELGEHLAALESVADAHGGTRAAGTPGYSASADYVDRALRDAGWRVRRQRLRFTYFDLHRASLRVEGRRLRRERDFQVLTYSGSGRVSGRVRSAGSGCSREDFAGLRPGEVPMVERRVCFFREKALLAQRAGAEAMLVSAETASRRGLYSGTLAVPGIRIPVVIASTRALRDVADGADVTVEVDADTEERRTENVIAETPGGTPEHVVMAGGHLDSVRGGPGINDNGSGVATLIEMAEAIGPEPSGARVRLAFWGAEELGLVGSRHYVESLDRAERRLIRGYLNLDVLGSPNAVPEVYVDGDPALARLLKRVTPGRLGSASAGAGSDHAPFQAAGIAVGGLYTGGPEPAGGGRPRDPCYHLSCDTAGNVDHSTLLRMARAAAEAVEALSERHK